MGTEPARKPGPIAKLRYRVDRTLSRGSVMVIGYLALITLTITVVAAGVLTALHLSGVNGGPKLGFAEAFWQSMLRMLGKGAFAADQQWTTRLLNLIVTLTGIFLAGALIALISASVNQRIARLRKGRSPVLETGHTLVLGWSPRLPVILSELVIANADRRGCAFVVLADHAKDEMEDELRRRVSHTGTTRVVCRTGDPGKPSDLDLVNARGARSIIVLAGADGDAGVVRSVIAVHNLDPDFSQVRLVAELESAHHAEALRSLTDGRIVTVQADEVIGSVTAQACHQNGLAGVFRELLGFAGSEIHFKHVDRLSGRTYGEAQLAFPTSSVIGLCHGGALLLNPPTESVIRADDEIIAIAVDDASMIVGMTGAPTTADVTSDAPLADSAQRIALIGWSPLGADVLAELDRVLGAGSTVELMIDRHHVAATDLAYPELHVIELEVREITPGPESLLSAIGQREYDHAIVLGYRDQADGARADARTMLTLLALHRAWSRNERRPRVVAEMLDRTNVDIARSLGVDDFIVSDELSSLMIAQLSERAELREVFRKLFDAEGCVLGLRPARLYAPLEGTVSFGAIVVAAAERGESAVGYQLGGDAVVVNPAKSTEVTLHETDRVLVLGPRPQRAEVAADRTVFPALTVCVPDSLPSDPAGSAVGQQA